MLIIVFLILLDEVVAEVNLALGKRGTNCEDKRRGDNAIFNEDKVTSVFMNARCQHHSFVDIRMDEKYLIHSATVFEGVRRNPLQENTLMRFVVILIDRSQNVTPHLCGQYPFYKPHNMAMVVNCLVFTERFAEIRLSSLKNFGLLLAEFEIYTLASKKNFRRMAIHRGCFKGFNPTVSELKIDNVTDCFQFCEDSRFAVAALQIDEDGNENCYCSSNYDETLEVSMTECDINCKSDDVICGGSHRRYSLYIVMVQLPHFLGCRFDNTTRFSESRKDMTITRCLKTCDSSQFALLKNMRHCTCANGSLSSSNSHCSSACSGDDNQICGGRNSASVYQTCLRDNEYSLKCSRLFNCLNDHDEYGLCSGNCRPGFIGRHCIERVTNAGACDIYPCKNNSKCVAVHDLRECSCISGFQLDPETDECIKEKNQVDYEATVFFLVFLSLIIIVLMVSYWQSSKNPTVSQPLVTTFIMPLRADPSDQEIKFLKRLRSKGHSLSELTAL